ncbi:CPXCG motif-containing cysteine-rich protein [Flavobacteriaceae bacterium Ap0902]|nr:CPXCG motif-containing cysteine-rich protein [Flavobacteriaceae bacterium Ap0902]
MIDHAFICPYCWESISMLIDASVSEQQYIEDCEVCCNPIEIFISFQHKEMINFEAHPLDQ